MNNRQDTMGRKVPRAAQSCAAISEALSDPLAGTAASARAWLLLEHPGPWGPDGLRQSGLADHLSSELERRADELGIRLLLIRRSPRRYAPERLTCFIAWTGRDGVWMHRHLLGSPTDVLALDLDALAAGRGPDPAHQWNDRVLAVCTHARRDACCARRGRPLAAALTEHDPAATWECSHLGGHRFAATMIAFPHGVCFGRVAPEGAARLADLHANGRIALDSPSAGASATHPPFKPPTRSCAPEKPSTGSTNSTRPPPNNATPTKRSCACATHTATSTSPASHRSPPA
jgi:hypothetical protein